jgi:hypothetical protein
VRDWTREAIAFARHALESEKDTPAGRLNAIWMVPSLAVVAGAGIFDALQALVRVWKPHYSAGLPSGLALFAVWAGSSLLCIALVGLMSPRREGG